MAQAQRKRQKSDPFKTRKTKQPPTAETDTLTPSTEIRKAIDLFRDYQEQAKHFEGEATVYKDKILAFSIEEYCKRVFKGQAKSFKLMGNESIVNYIVQDSSAGLSEDDLDEFIERWGDKAANDLIVKDFASIRLNPQILEDHYEKIVAALQSLPEEILDNLFKPMLMKASPHAIEKAKKIAKTPKELEELIRHLKIKNYIK
ncbi:MAG: hypothetical protein HYW48_00255 [Deltaproteobacteria bacterium]|nr:hypothetical protein [Deltaproteobacteria bacterium]